MLDNWILGNSSLLGPGCVKADDVSESEDVFKFLALEGVLVDVDSSVCAGDAASDQLCMGPGWRVNVSRDEGLFYDFTRVNAFESRNLLANRVVGNLLELPAKVHLDAALMTLVEHNLVHVREL